MLLPATRPLSHGWDAAPPLLRLDGARVNDVTIAKCAKSVKLLGSRELAELFVLLAVMETQLEAIQLGELAGRYGIAAGDPARELAAHDGGHEAQRRRSVELAGGETLAELGPERCELVVVLELLVDVVDTRRRLRLRVDEALNILAAPERAALHGPGAANAAGLLRPMERRSRTPADELERLRGREEL